MDILTYAENKSNSYNIDFKIELIKQSDPPKGKRSNNEQEKMEELSIPYRNAIQTSLKIMISLFSGGWSTKKLAIFHRSGLIQLLLETN